MTIGVSVISRSTDSFCQLYCDHVLLTEAVLAKSTQFDLDNFEIGDMFEGYIR